MSHAWMRVAAMIACLSAAAASQDRCAPLGCDETQALDAFERGDLEQLRGASSRMPAGLSPAERADLARVQAQSQGLDELRAGEISDHDFKLIMITAAVVVVIALLL